MNNPQEGALDPAAVTEIWQIRDNPAHAYNNPNARDHDTAKAHMRSLYERGYGMAPIVDGVVQAGEAAPIRGPESANEEPAPIEIPDEHSTPPDPGLAPVWHDVGVRELATTVAEIGMPAAEVADWIRYAGQTDPATIPQPEETLAQLRQEWGVHYERKLGAALLVAERLPASTRAVLNQSGLGDDPRLIRRLAELGAPLLEAREAIDRILADRTNPYYDGQHPRHQVARAGMRKLYVKVYGNRPLE
jgi:hypothetical protein